MPLYNSGSSLPPTAGHEGDFLSVVTSDPAWITLGLPLVFKGVIDASASPNYPAASAGHIYVFSVSGKIGGASGTDVTAQDAMICLIDTIAGDQTDVGASWSVMPANVLGQVIGPTSAVSSNFAAFDTTSGKLVKDSGFKATSFDIMGSSATVQGNLTTHAGLTGAAAHGLGTAATHAAGDFEAAGLTATHAAFTSGVHGLGTASQQNVGYFATAAQGTKADSAYAAAVTNATAGNTDGTIVKRGTDGNFSAGTITATLAGTATNLRGTPALPNGTTATTQTDADDSAKLATTAYVDRGLATKVDTYGSQTANTFLAAPTGADGVPVFRAMVAADLPATITRNTSGTAANLSGTPALPNGTTATTQTAKDASTKLATTAYVDAATAKLVIADVSSSPYNLTNATDIAAVTGIVQVNLPAATGTSKLYRIKALDGAVTVTPDGSDTIDGLASAIQISGLPGVAQPTLTLIDGGIGVWYKI